MTAPNHPESPPTSDRPPAAVSKFNPWPASIVATFVVFVAGTISLVVLASKDRSDLVAADYYEQEIRYQSRIDQIRRTEPFAREITAAYDPARGQVTLALPARHAAAGTTGEVCFYRPNHAGADLSFPLAVDSKGIQHLPAPDLKPGLWKVRLHWKFEAQDYFADRPLVVPGSGTEPRR